jgi:hypothetical protein
MWWALKVLSSSSNSMRFLSRHLMQKTGNWRTSIKEAFHSFKSMSVLTWKN